MNLYVVSAGFFKSDGGALFGTIPKRVWQKTNPADENNLCEMMARCLLVQEDSRLILIDTGIGTKQDEKYLRHHHLHGDDTLEKSILKHGFSLNDITDVLLTHLHFDHVGGAFSYDENKNIVPTFPNAIYWSNQQQWDWATVDFNVREKASYLDENLFPMHTSGKLKMLPCEEGFEFTANIKIRFANGHTCAMMMPQINYYGETLLYMADLIPFSSQIPIGYFPAFDVAPLIVMQEKKKILQEAVNNNYTLMFDHDPYTECATVQMTEKGIRLKDTFLLKEWIK